MSKLSHKIGENRRKKRILLYAQGNIPAREFGPVHYPEGYKDQIEGCEIITFGLHDGVDIKINPEDDFAKVLEDLPAGWAPDLVVFVHVLCNFLPKGIEKSPFPLIQIYSDPDHDVFVSRTFNQIFDLGIVGGDVAKETAYFLGANNVEVLYNCNMMKEFFPSSPKTIKERQYDIIFTPCIDDIHHLDRSKWVLRLCNLADKYKVFMISDKPNYKDYLKLLQNSKLAFSYHRYGEMSFRVIEAGSQGAIPVDVGAETRKYLKEDTEFISVTEENIFAKIEQFLSDEEQLQKMSDRIYSKIQKEFDSRRFFARVLELAMNALKENKIQRNFNTLSEADKFQRRGEIYYNTVFRGVAGETVLVTGAKLLRLSIQEFEKSLALRKCPRTLTSLAVAKLSLGFMYSGENPGLAREIESAIFILNEVLSLHPKYALAHYNLGLALLALEMFKEAYDTLNNALELFNDSESEVDPWCLYNKGIYSDLFNAMISQSLDEYQLLFCKQKKEMAIKNIRHLYEAATLYFISTIEEANGYIYASLEHIQKAYKLHPKCGMVTEKVAIKLAVLGFKQKSMDMYKKIIELLPFNIDLRMQYVKILYLYGLDNEVLIEINNLLKITKNITSFNKRNLDLKKMVDNFIRIYSKKSKGYSHDSYREQILTTWIDGLYTCLRFDPGNFRLISRIIEIWYELGRVDKIAELIEEYINNPHLKGSVDKRVLSSLNELIVACATKDRELKLKLNRLKRLTDNLLSNVSQRDAPNYQHVYSNLS